jgi:hypothetical protein
VQAVSANFTTKTSAPVRDLTHGVLVSWLKSINPAYQYFTIGQSKIGGPDKIKSSGTAAITFFDKYQYSDESVNATRWAVSRKLSQYPWGMVMAQADIELRNTSKRYMPGFDGTIGAYVDKTARPVKISVGFDNEPIMQFVGYTNQPTSSLQSRTTTLTAFDALSYLNDYVIQNIGTLVNYTFTQILTAILTEAGFTSTQYSLDVSLQQPIGYIALKDKQAGPILKQLVEAEMGLLFVDENGIIRFWNRQHLNNSASIVYTFNYSNMRNIEWDSSPVINDVQVVSKPRFEAPKQKLWENASAIRLDPGVDNLVVADFRDDDGSLPVTSVDTPAYITGATTSYYATNLNEDGTSEDDGSGYVTLSSASVAGDSYIMHFANSGPYPVYITKTALFAVPAKVVAAESNHYIDQTSIDNYGRNPTGNGVPLVLSNDFVQESSTANSIAYTLLQEYKTPRKRLKCTVFAVPQLQMGDYVNVVIDDTGETLPMFVLAITNKLELGGNLVQDLQLEQRTVKRYFTIGQSAIAGGVSPNGTHTIAP